jgi:hypothetical protein
MSSGEVSAAANSEGVVGCMLLDMAESRVWRLSRGVAFHRRARGVGGGLQSVGWHILLRFVDVRKKKLNGGQAKRRPRTTRSLPLFRSVGLGILGAAFSNSYSLPRGFSLGFVDGWSTCTSSPTPSHSPSSHHPQP